MLMKVSYFLHQLTGEVFNSKAKKSLSEKEQLFLQSFKASQPIVFLTENDEGDYEAKSVELSELNDTTINKMKSLDAILALNYKPNNEVVRKFKVCPHCLSQLTQTNQKALNLKDFEQHIELRQTQLKYFEKYHCEECNQTQYIAEYKVGSYADTSILKDFEIIAPVSYQISEMDSLFVDLRVTNVVQEKVVEFNELPEINQLSDIDMICNMYKNIKAPIIKEYFIVNNARHFESKKVSNNYKEFIKSL